MNEFSQSLIAGLSVIPSLIFALTASIGGRSGTTLGLTGRIWKRLIAPIVFVSGVMVVALIEQKFSWWMVSLYATYFISCMRGYGVKKEEQQLLSAGQILLLKIFRRSIWSIIRTLACLPLALLTGSYTLIILQAMIGVICTLGLGVWNPLKAPVEEYLINMISVIFVPFMLLY